VIVGLQSARKSVHLGVPAGHSRTFSRARINAINILPTEADEGLGDGMFLVVEGQAGGPLDEVAKAGLGEAVGVGLEQFLPQGTQVGNVPGGTSRATVCWVGSTPTTSAREVAWSSIMTNCPGNCVDYEFRSQ
jgi:hypothetical protein